MENRLTKEDFDLINKLLNNAIKIHFIYEELCVIESYGNKDCNDYKDRIEILKLLRKEEKNIYLLFKEDYTEITKIMDFFNKYGDYNFSEELELAKIYDVGELARIRITYNLSKIIFDEHIEEYENEAMYDNDIDEEEYEFNEEYQEEIEQEKSEDVFHIGLEHYVEMDIIKTILFILDKYINNKEYSKIKDYLIRFKYTLSYMYFYLEDDFIKNNFNIPDKLYWNAKLFLDMCKGDNKTYYDKRLDYGSEILDLHLDYLINLSDYELKDDNNYAKSIISQIIVRTAKLVGKDIELNSVIELLNTEAFNENYLLTKKIITDSISNNKDEELPNILSLKRDL